MKLFQNRKRVALLAGILLLLGAIFAGYKIFGPDPQLARIADQMEPNE